MRIALLSLYLPSHVRGGVPVQVHLLGNGLVGRGHEVEVYSLYPAPEDARYRVVQVSLPRPLDAATRRWNGLGIHLFPAALRRLDFSGYDIVHAHGDSHFLPGGREVDRRTVRTFHSAGIHLAWCAVRCLRIRTALGLFSVYPFEVLSGLRAGRRVVVAPRLKRFFPLGGVEVVPNALDPLFESPGDPVPRSTHPSILFVAGSMGGTKRGSLLLRAFEREVRPALPEAELWMVCRERPQVPGVRGFGNLAGKDLVRLYRSAWVLCHPSAYESFGLPYLEAMASATPVVATPTDGASDVLGPGGGGIVVPPRRIGEALLRVLSDPFLRERLGARGVEHAKDFSLSRMLDRYEAIYREVAA